MATRLFFPALFVAVFLLTLSAANANENANDDPVKSWTRDGVPNRPADTQFLSGLTWRKQRCGPYILNLGYVDKWIAALQFARRDGTIVMTEITPVQEYITIIDPITGNETKRPHDANHDGIPEIAFLHQKLYDKNYHMYTVYSLTRPKPKLLWKSGGKLGDWLVETH